MTAAEGVAIGLGFLAIVAPDFWPKMPKSLSYTLAGIGLAWLTYSGILAIENYTHMPLQRGPLALLILGACSIGVGIFWHISRIGSEPKAEVASPGLFIECSFVPLPMSVTRGDRIFVLNLYPTPIENGGGGIGEMTAGESNEFKIPGVRYLHKCVLTS